MIIVMARRACSPLACLTSLTPPEQPARLNDKVVPANPSWFKAPRKIDTYFSLLRCSLKCDIINCSSSPFFLLLLFLIWRFKAVGHRGHWAGLSQCQWSSSSCLLTLGFYSAEGKKNDWQSRSESLPAPRSRTVKDACIGFFECFEQFSFSWVLSGYSGALWPHLFFFLLCLFITQLT